MKSVLDVADVRWSCALVPLAVVFLHPQLDVQRSSVDNQLVSGADARSWNLLSNHSWRMAMPPNDKAQRRRPRGAPIATATARRRSLQRMVELSRYAAEVAGCPGGHRDD